VELATATPIHAFLPQSGFPWQAGPQKGISVGNHDTKLFFPDFCRRHIGGKVQQAVYQILSEE